MRSLFYDMHEVLYNEPFLRKSSRYENYCLLGCVTPCSLVHIYGRYPEMSANIYRTTRRHISVAGVRTADLRIICKAGFYI
jgi:hypothetical protein